MAVLGILAGIEVAGKVAQGFAANKASKKEANLLRDQGDLAQEEAYADSQREADEGRKFAQRQKLSFLKNGVTLEGSPLLILEETFADSQKQVDAIAKRGVAQKRLAYQQAGITRNQGRAALLAGIAGGAGTAANYGFSAQEAGLF